MCLDQAIEPKLTPLPPASGSNAVPSTPMYESFAVLAPTKMPLAPPDIENRHKPLPFTIRRRCGSGERLWTGVSKARRRDSCLRRKERQRGERQDEPESVDPLPANTVLRRACALQPSPSPSLLVSQSFLASILPLVRSYCQALTSSRRGRNMTLPPPPPPRGATRSAQGRADAAAHVPRGAPARSMSVSTMLSKPESWFLCSRAAALAIATLRAITSSTTAAPVARLFARKRESVLASSAGRLSARLSNRKSCNVARSRVKSSFKNSRIFLGLTGLRKRVWPVRRRTSNGSSTLTKRRRSACRSSTMGVTTSPTMATSG